MKIINEEEGGVPVNNTSGVASLNPSDPRNPPVFPKKKKLLKDILRRKG
jgi:hypothetical protein